MLLPSGLYTQSYWAGLHIYRLSVVGIWLLRAVVQFRRPRMPPSANGASESEPIRSLSLIAVHQVHARAEALAVRATEELLLADSAQSKRASSFRCRPLLPSLMGCLRESTRLREN